MTDRPITVISTHLDRVVPEAGAYSIDPAHSSVSFVARHLMITKVRGRISAVSGTITIAEDPVLSHVEAMMEAASLDTGNADRDRHLRSPDFFDVERHPTITYRSTRVRTDQSQDWVVSGELAIREVSRHLDLPVVFEGTRVDPDGAERIGFSAAVDVDRNDWGLSWNRALETGGLLIAPTVRIELEIQAFRSS